MCLECRKNGHLCRARCILESVSLGRHTCCRGSAVLRVSCLRHVSRLIIGPTRTLWAAEHVPCKTLKEMRRWIDGREHRSLTSAGLWGENEVSDVMDTGVVPILSASTDAGCGTRPGRRRQKLRSGCQRALKELRMASMYSSLDCGPHVMKKERVDRQMEKSTALGSRATSTHGAQRVRNRVATASTTPRH